MKEDLTRRTLKCAGCGDYFVPLDDSNLCEKCTPLDCEDRQSFDLGDCEE